MQISEIGYMYKVRFNWLSVFLYSDKYRTTFLNTNEPTIINFVYYNI